MSTATRLVPILIALIVLGCGDAKNQGQTKSKSEEDTMATSGKFSLSSSAFKDGEMIPQKYTADGQNVSPPLKWDSIPTGSKSLALIADDPDAPMGTWVHWVIFNIPITETGLPEGIPTKASLPDGSLQGTNGSHELGYDGPSPPSGTHRYYFKLFALDTLLKLSSGITKPELLKAMEGHIVGQAQLMGRYSRR